jgi:hypothetical protein
MTRFISVDGHVYKIAEDVDLFNVTIINSKGLVIAGKILEPTSPDNVSENLTGSGDPADDASTA